MIIELLISASVPIVSGAIAWGLEKTADMAAARDFEKIKKKDDEIFSMLVASQLINSSKETKENSSEYSLDTET